MCARYSLVPDEFRQIRIEFKLEQSVEFPTRYNIAPSWSSGHEVPIVVAKRAGGNELMRARFWMIPNHWSRPLRALPTAFNARSEELGQRPFWSQSFERRRCLIPATGWREFQGAPGAKRPYQFHHESGFAFAGLWDEWRSPEDGKLLVRSFAIVTQAANETVKPIHSRMPLCVSPGQYDSWLSSQRSGSEALAEVLAEPLALPKVYECDPVGNDSRREGPDCIAPVQRRQLGLFD